MPIKSISPEKSAHKTTCSVNSYQFARNFLGEVLLCHFSLFLLRNLLAELHAQLTLTSLPGIFWRGLAVPIQSEISSLNYMLS